MANTSSKTKPSLSSAISYGLSGGPAHARKISKLLRQAGYTPTKNFIDADVVIAHSAGCWLIPDTARPKMVVYIGMPLAQARPRRTWMTANTASFIKGNVLRNTQTRFKNTYYWLRQPVRNVNIVRNAKIARPVILPGVPAVFISNRHDPWPKSERLQTHLDTKDWAFISLPGTHDDIWEHPERYVAIINHYARLLA